MKFGDVMRWHNEEWDWRVMYVARRHDRLLLLTLGALPETMESRLKPFYMDGVFEWDLSLNDWVRDEEANP